MTNHILPRPPLPLQVSVTLDHIALQAELLVHEIRAASLDHRLEQRDVDQLHYMVQCCNLFLNPEGDNHG